MSVAARLIPPAPRHLVLAILSSLVIGRINRRAMRGEAAR